MPRLLHRWGRISIWTPAFPATPMPVTHARHPVNWCFPRTPRREGPRAVNWYTPRAFWFLPRWRPPARAPKAPQPTGLPPAPRGLRGRPPRRGPPRGSPSGAHAGGRGPIQGPAPDAAARRSFTGHPATPTAESLPDPAAPVARSRPGSHALRARRADPGPSGPISPHYIPTDPA
jgi:hypothetical protein